MLTVRPYRDADCSDWECVVSASRNGTFLLTRAYIDHAQKHTDHSLVVHDGDAAVAILPAVAESRRIVSHPGLTYGGLIWQRELRGAEVLEILSVCASFLREEGFDQLVYKTVPRIYHAFPAEEDRYWLFANGATLSRRDMLSVIDYRERLPPHEMRARSVRKARAHDVRVKETGGFAEFWPILTSNLETRYGLQPVHSCAEIENLAGRFPQHIKLLAAYHGETMLAGAVLYLSDHVCHVQYNAASPEGKTVGALDLLLDTAIEAFAGSKRFFDFGISTYADGTRLNVGLLDYKERFGACTVCHDFYTLDLEKFNRA